VVGSSSWVMLPLIIARFLLLSEYHASLADVCHKIICKMCSWKEENFFMICVKIVGRKLEENCWKLETVWVTFANAQHKMCFAIHIPQLLKFWNIQIQTAEPCCKTSWVKAPPPSTRGCVSHTMALPFTMKSILRQKKNYGNSNISHHAKIIIFKKIL